jgi:hypothetical protein
LHRKSCFEKAGLFNEDLNVLMDWELWLRFSEHFQFLQLNQLTGEYRWGLNNMSRNNLEMQFTYKLISLYYASLKGKTVKMIAYAQIGELQKAKKLWNVVITEISNSSFVYDKGIKESFDALCEMPGRFWLHRGALCLFRKSFAIQPRDCVQKFIEKKAIMPLIYILLFLPKKILSKVFVKVEALLTSRIKLTFPLN